VDAEGAISSTGIARQFRLWSLSSECPE